MQNIQNQSTSPKSSFSSTYKWYVLFLLLGVNIAAHLDKQLIVILQESIKADLGLSDTQLGLVTGIAFSVAYTLFGIPVAQLADRFNRKNIIAISLAFWSGITALTGFAKNYWQLFIARVGVGLGETGSVPPSLSLIADYFPKTERARAYAVHGMGIYFGLLLGFLVGGLVEEAYGWRFAFWVVGTPGIVFALLLFLTVKEPLRGRMDERTIENEKVPTFREVIRLLLSKPSVILLTIGTVLHVLVGSAFANWMPPFFIRVHGMGTAEIGIWLAFAIGVCGAFGTYLGGYLTDRFAKKDVRFYLWIPAISFSLSLPFALGVLFFPYKTGALLFYLMPNVLYAFFVGPAYTLVQDMVAIRMRATASAVFVILLSLFGAGLGPFIAGMLSDALQPTYGINSISWALFILCFLEIPAIYCYWRAARTIKRDLI